MAAGALFAGAFYLGGLAPKSALEALQAADWQDKYQTSQIALSAVQGQLKQAQDVSASNTKTIQGLNDANAKITADRATYVLLAQRLLNSAKNIPSISPTVPEAKGGQPTASPGATSSDGQAAGLLADTASECLRNAAQLNSLIAEITPQL